ncbi:MAG: cysteine--tRNA ligase [Ignavibacteria bacterium]|nr:cysteine--tRNA ligase [Ignavibacteria bacterium]
MKNLYLFNTLSRRKEKFIPLENNKVKMYCCGPTVYNYAHIGNLRTYFFEDILKRVLLYNSYEVFHVMNITDVGHLVSDADEGEDKMEKGARREGKTVWEIAEFYTEAFKKDLSELNILYPDIWCRATENIEEQIKLIQCLEKKGYTYITSDGVYYDTSKFKDYGKLALLDIEGLEEGKRIAFSEEKRNKTDFALWKFSPKDVKRQMEWDSPWGKGFPGWHIECSAMSMKYLGETFDIHCGGVDHIPIHHTNEIAQSEGCTGKQFVRYWLHGEFLIEEKGKMAKSAGEFLRLPVLIEKGYSGLDYRYFMLMTHYRKKLKFSYVALDSAKKGFNNLKNEILELKDVIKKKEVQVPDYGDEKMSLWRERFIESINDDLNVTEGLGILWDMLKDGKLKPEEKLSLVDDFDRVLGLKLIEVEEEKIPKEILDLVEKRRIAKLNKQWEEADKIRDEIKAKGYEVLDLKNGTTKVRKII